MPAGPFIFFDFSGLAALQYIYAEAPEALFKFTVLFMLMSLISLANFFTCDDCLSFENKHTWLTSKTD